MSDQATLEPSTPRLWIESLAAAPSPEEFLAELCQRLVEAGVPLHRAAVFQRTLHPNVMGRRYVWRAGGGVAVSEAPRSALQSDEFLDNPIRVVFRDGQSIRRRLEDPTVEIDYPVLDEFRAEGATDYYVYALPFTNGEIHATSWTTNRPGGFSASDVAMLDSIRLPLTRLVEICALRRTAITLLDTYVGHGAGERILSGRITRGDAETIHAVTWLSDLRGFTQLAEDLAGEKLLHLLNDYFDAIVPAIEEQGGEVLKFMGDGLLAIFPVGTETRDEAAASQAALAAARAARERMAARNAKAERKGHPVLRFGIALTMGDVLFGNIGGMSRLDFTTIGRSVNVAARLEGLAAELARDIVLTAPVAGHCLDEVESLGRHTLRGLREPIEVFALPSGSGQHAQL